MPKTWSLPVLALGLAACAAGARGPSAASGPPPVRAPSIYGLLGERERLELTSIQVERLDSIGRWIASATDSLEENLAPRDRAGDAPPDSTEVGTLRDAVTAANEQVIDTVEALLTAEQRETVCEIQREERDREERRNDDQARSRPFGGQNAVSARPRWTWCADEQATPDASQALERSSRSHATNRSIPASIGIDGRYPSSASARETSA